MLENVKEIWTEVPKSGKGKKKAKAITKDRFIPKVRRSVCHSFTSCSCEVIVWLLSAVIPI